MVDFIERLRLLAPQKQDKRTCNRSRFESCQNKGKNSIQIAESTTYSYISDCNWTRTQNHLVCKRTLQSSPVAVTKTSDFTPVSSKEFLDIQASIDCRFTLKRVRDITRTYSHFLIYSYKSLQKRFFYFVMFKVIKGVLNKTVGY